jgi:hypothetical protein
MSRKGTDDISEKIRQVVLMSRKGTDDMSEKIQQVASHFLIIKNVCDRYVRPKI